MRWNIVTFAAALAVLPLFAGPPVRADERGVTRIDKVRSAYLEHCGGCHGIQGTSAPHEIPSLRGQVASFLCTPEGRAYLIRLPNVALTPLSDQMLADVMNFVVLELDASSDQRTRTIVPYSAAEVAKLRRQALTDNGLAKYRERIVNDLIKRCGAPASLRAYDVVATARSPSSR